MSKLVCDRLLERGCERYGPQHPPFEYNIPDIDYNIVDAVVGGLAYAFYPTKETPWRVATFNIYSENKFKNDQFEELVDLAIDIIMELSDENRGRISKRDIADVCNCIATGEVGYVIMEDLDFFIRQYGLTEDEEDGARDAVARYDKLRGFTQNSSLSFKGAGSKRERSGKKTERKYRSTLESTNTKPTDTDQKKTGRTYGLRNRDTKGHGERERPRGPESWRPSAEQPYKLAFNALEQKEQYTLNDDGILVQNIVNLTEAEIMNENIHKIPVEAAARKKILNQHFNRDGSDEEAIIDIPISPTTAAELELWYKIPENYDIVSISSGVITSDDPITAINNTLASFRSTNTGKVPLVILSGCVKTEMLTNDSNSALKGVKPFMTILDSFEKGSEVVRGVFNERLDPYFISNSLSMEIINSRLTDAMNEVLMYRMPQSNVRCSDVFTDAPDIFATILNAGLADKFDIELRKAINKHMALGEKILTMDAETIDEVAGYTVDESKYDHIQLLCRYYARADIALTSKDLGLDKLKVGETYEIVEAYVPTIHKLLNGIGAHAVNRVKGNIPPILFMVTSDFEVFYCTTSDFIDSKNRLLLTRMGKNNFNLFK